MKQTTRMSFTAGSSREPNPVEKLLLGYRNDKMRLDLSDYVVHFTKDADDSAYNNMLSILGKGILIPGQAPFGCARHIRELDDLNRAVCFSETPLGYLSRFVQRRSEFGIAFRKDFIIKQGAQAVWYVSDGTATASAIKKLMTAGKMPDEKDGRRRLVDRERPIWQLCPFIEFTRGFGKIRHQFEWEREWRLLGSLKFQPADVAFLLIPEKLHGAARGFFKHAEEQNVGPNYSCPYVDGLWKMDRLIPLHLRLRKHLDDFRGSLMEYKSRAPALSAEIDKLLSVVDEFGVPNDPIPEKTGKGYREFTIEKKSRSWIDDEPLITSEEIQDLLQEAAEWCKEE